MSSQHHGQYDIGTEDPLGLLARSAQRSPLQELRDYPFFAPEDERPAPVRTIRYGGILLAMLALIITLEVIVLTLLLR